MTKNQSAKRILLCVNSDIGRSNTIGFRFGMVADALQHAGIETTLIARANYDQDRLVTVPWYRNYLARMLNGIRIYLLPQLSFRTFEVKLFDAFVLAQLKKDHAYDAIHFGESLPRAIAYAKAQGIKTFLDMPIGVIDYRHYKEQKKTVDDAYHPRVYAPFVDAALTTVDHVIAPSQFVSDSLTTAGYTVPRTIVPFGATLPATVDADYIAARAKKTPLTFVFAGNVNYRKGIDVLLAAWEAVKIPHARLVVCGRVYKEVKDVVALADSSVEFKGFVPMASVLAESHVFVFPTYVEGSAKAVYEAMSYGLPVITTPNAGSIIDDEKDGYIIPAGDVHALADRLQQLAVDRTLLAKMGTAARDHVAAYSWERYAESVISCYDI